MEPSLQEIQGLRVAVEGCGHGTLNAIYAATEKACEMRGWDGVDLLIIGGDFQAVRNAYDLTVMSCPVKYREIGDFHDYYSSRKTAAYLTIFVGGNHEATSHLWELFYGGWVAPNIYYMGAANVLRLGPVRIAGMSGIWKGMDYNKTHYERLPYNSGDIKSAYHVREIDIRKLLQIRSQVDIGISHDWPRAIEKDGNQRDLWRMKPDFEQESKDSTLGNAAATYVMDRLRPPYWFAAHMHCKFSATKIYEDEKPVDVQVPADGGMSMNGHAEASKVAIDERPNAILNSDEIDLDMDDEEEPSETTSPAPKTMPTATIQATNSLVSDDIRALLPASFSRPAPQSSKGRPTPGQPVPAGITNKAVRFLALDKCLPGRKFLQLLDILPASAPPQNPSVINPAQAMPRYRLQYDPEWLAITRVFAPSIKLGDRSAQNAADIGETAYHAQIEKEEAWVEENIVEKGRLEVPLNFVITAPIHEAGMPEIVQEQPREYNNPQMSAFCDLVGIENMFFATDEEREARMLAGPAPEQLRFDGGRGGRGGGGRGGGRGRGGHGGGGRGRGNFRGGRGSNRGRAW